MSWEAVARKDFHDAVRARWLWVLTAILILVFSLAAYLVRPAPGQTVSTNAIMSNFILSTLVTMIVPLAALVVSYDSITGEQETGSIKLLLSLPHSRNDVVAGKLAGRSLAVAVPIVVGFVLPALILAVGPLTFDLFGYITFVTLTALLGAAFVGIALGLSAATGSQRISLAGSVGAFFLFIPLWKAIQFPLQLYLATRDSLYGINPNELFRYLDLINPTGAYKHLLGSINTSGSQDVLLALALLWAWVLIPPLLGAIVFETRDL